MFTRVMGAVLSSPPRIPGIRVRHGCFILGHCQLQQPLKINKDIPLYFIISYTKLQPKEEKEETEVRKGKGAGGVRRREKRREERV